MDVRLAPGKYVMAVSGGVDSMALLHMLARQMAGDELVVAHFEHGIRPDSIEDLWLVEDAARRLGLPFIYEHGHLGEGASELQARDARYGFLRRVQAEQGARAIITAHHQDDVLETAILNGLRGTGSRGLSSLQSSDELVRPLLHVPKQELVRYAQANGLVWREDSTNQDLRYRRNYIRHKLVPRLDPPQRAALLARIAAAVRLNREIDQLVRDLLANQSTPDTLERRWFIRLPYSVSAEVMAAWLRIHGLAFDRRTIHRLVVFAKTARPGKHADVDAIHYLQAAADVVTLSTRPRALQKVLR